MSRTLSHKIVSSKIDILAEQRNYLQTFVDETNEVLQLATSWLRNEEDITNSFKSTDINRMIEDKLAFLVGTDFSVGCEKTAGDQESVATRSFPAASKSNDQAFPAGPGQVSGVSVASDEIKTIMNQVKVMQDAMSFLSTSSEKLSEKQLAMDKFVESLSDKYSQIEQTKIKEIEIELKSICENLKKVATQQDKHDCHQQQSKIKDYNKENERLQTQSQQMTQDLSDVRENIQELNSRISVLENQAVTNTQLEALVNRVEFLETSSEVLSAKFEEHGSSLEEFTRTEETLKDLPSVRGKEFEQLQKFEEKLSAVEKSCSETSQKSGKLYQDVETKYNMVCQFIADRLAPLERLRDMFNEKLDVRERNVKKLDTVCDQMANLLPKFSQLGLKEETLDHNTRARPSKEINKMDTTKEETLDHNTRARPSKEINKMDTTLGSSIQTGLLSGPVYKEVDYYVSGELNISSNIPISEHHLLLLLTNIDKDYIGQPYLKSPVTVLLSILVSNIVQDLHKKSTCKMKSSISKTIRFLVEESCFIGRNNKYLYEHLYRWNYDEFNTTWDILLLFKKSNIKGHLFSDLPYDQAIELSKTLQLKYRVNSQGLKEETLKHHTRVGPSKGIDEFKTNLRSITQMSLSSSPFASLEKDLEFDYHVRGSLDIASANCISNYSLFLLLPSIDWDYRGDEYLKSHIKVLLTIMICTKKRCKSREFELSSSISKTIRFRGGESCFLERIKETNYLYQQKFDWKYDEHITKWHVRLEFTKSALKGHYAYDLLKDLDIEPGFKDTLKY